MNLKLLYSAVLAGWTGFASRIDNYAYDFLFGLYPPQAWAPESAVLAIDEEEAVEQILAGNVGCMVALQGTRIDTVPLKDVASRIKPVDPRFYRHLSMIQSKIR